MYCWFQTRSMKSNRLMLHQVIYMRHRHGRYPYNVEQYWRLLVTRGEGNLPWFWVRMCGWSTQTYPIHIHGEVKKQTHSYTFYSENCIHSFTNYKILPIHILIIKFYPFIYFFGEKDTPLIYFWCENDTHSYTRRPEKYTPFHPLILYIPL